MTLWRDLEIGDIIQDGDRYALLLATTDGGIIMLWRNWECGPVPYNSHHPVIQRLVEVRK